MALSVFRRGVTQRWSRIAVAVVAWLGYRILAARYRNADPFMFWVEVGVAVFTLLVTGVMVAIDSGSRAPRPESERKGLAGNLGIDHWMPIVLLALLVVGLVTTWLATAP